MLDFSLQTVLLKISYVWILFCFLFTFSCPSLTIPGFTHPVVEYFLSDVHEMLGQARLQPSHPQGKRFKPDKSFVKVFLPTFFLIFSALFVSSNDFFHDEISYRQFSHEYRLTYYKCKSLIICIYNIWQVLMYVNPGNISNEHTLIKP